MTIASNKNTPRVAYTATADQQAFTIPFEFFSVADIKVYNGTTLLTYDANADAVTEYSITGAASDSDDAYEFGAGGTVNIGATGISAGTIITIIRDITIERASDFSPSGTFDITALNTDLDKVYAKLADIDQQSDRSVKLLDTDSISATVTLPAKATRASKVLTFDSDGNVTTTYTAVDTSTVAGIASDVTTVAGISSNVTTVAGISSNVTSVAGVSSNVTTVAGISANVTTVAGISSNVTSVAGIASNVTTVANNISDVNNFAAVYRIGSSDPSSSLDEGDLFYNSTSNVLKYYNGSSWINIDSGDLDFQADSGGALSIEDNETLTFTGGTGIDTSGSGNAVTFAIDSTVTTLTGSQTLTNKTLTTPVISSISNTGTLTLPTSTDTLVGRATTDTFTNKSGNISQWTNDSAYLTGNQTITLSGDVSGSGTTAITVTIADDSHNHVISNVDGLQTALDAKLANVVEDTTPQLGGNLDVNGNDIVSTSNANIDIVPNGTGDVTLQTDTVQIGDSNANATVTTNGTGDLILNTNAGTNSGNITIADGSNGNITVTPNGTGNVSLGNLTFDADQTVGSGQDNYVLTYDNSGGVISLEAAAGGGGGLEVISAVNNYNSSGNTTSYSFTGFDSTYDNYYVIIHGITQHGQGDLQMRFLDDGSAITSSNYRQTTLGLTHTNSEKRITTDAASLFTLVEQQNNGEKDPMNGWMYFNNGRGGRWDSDSNDSEGAVSPSVVYMLGGEGSNGSSRIAIGHGYINDTEANTCNGFQLIFAGGDGAYKVNLTVYGVKRA
jgi:hypothetical protein